MREGLHFVISRLKKGFILLFIIADEKEPHVVNEATIFTTTGIPKHDKVKANDKSYHITSWESDAFIKEPNIASSSSLILIKAST